MTINLKIKNLKKRYQFFLGNMTIFKKQQDKTIINHESINININMKKAIKMKESYIIKIKKCYNLY